MGGNGRTSRGYQHQYDTLHKVNSALHLTHLALEKKRKWKNCCKFLKIQWNSCSSSLLVAIVNSGNKKLGPLSILHQKQQFYGRLEQPRASQTKDADDHQNRLEVSQKPTENGTTDDRGSSGSNSTLVGPWTTDDTHQLPTPTPSNAGSHPKTRVPSKTPNPQTSIQLAFFVAHPPPLSHLEAPPLSARRHSCQRSQGQGQQSTHPNASANGKGQHRQGGRIKVRLGCCGFWLGVDLFLFNLSFSQ